MLLNYILPFEASKSGHAHVAGLGVNIDISKKPEGVGMKSDPQRKQITVRIAFDWPSAMLSNFLRLSQTRYVNERTVSN